jgi:hypothetical protein
MTVEPIEKVVVEVQEDTGIEKTPTAPTKRSVILFDTTATRALNLRWRSANSDQDLKFRIDKLKEVCVEYANRSGWNMPAAQLEFKAYYVGTNSDQPNSFVLKLKRSGWAIISEQLDQARISLSDFADISDLRFQPPCLDDKLIYALGRLAGQAPLNAIVLSRSFSVWKAIKKTLELSDESNIRMAFFTVHLDPRIPISDPAFIVMDNEFELLTGRKLESLPGLNNNNSDVEQEFGTKRNTA